MLHRFSIKSRFRFSLPSKGSSPSPHIPSARDPISPEATHAFAETVLWCSRQDLRAESDDPDYLRNRVLLEQRMFINVDFGSLCPLSLQLRSPALQPKVSMEESYEKRDECEASFAELISVRSRLMAADGEIDVDQVLLQRRGRLLIYQPWENVADGASQVASLGFFDLNDAPPWDTWIHYADGRLACWVPEQLIKLAQDGIDANAVQCIDWADQMAH